MTNVKVQRANVLDPLEIHNMILKADSLDTPYFQWRAKALVELAQVSGKRNGEIAAIRIDGLTFPKERKVMQIAFTLEKKKKLGLTQYVQSHPEKQEQDFKQTWADWQEWRKTREGQKIIAKQRIKEIDLSDSAAKTLLKYAEILKQECKEATYLFPSGRMIFGTHYLFIPDRHLSTRQILRIVKWLNPQAWVHLFRETKGAQVVQQGGDSISTIFDVMLQLDLENFTTAFNYVRRYGIQKLRRNNNIA